MCGPERRGFSLGHLPGAVKRSRCCGSSKTPAFTIQSRSQEIIALLPWTVLCCCPMRPSLLCVGLAFKARQVGGRLTGKMAGLQGCLLVNFGGA